MAFVTPLSLPSSSRAARSTARVCAPRRPHSVRAQLPSNSSAASSAQPSFPTCIDALLQTLRDQEHTRQAHSQGSAPAKVHLVGTGPGDPSLLTLRSLHHMQTADVILYDRLVSHDILQLCNRDAQLIYVGKQAGFHTRTQHDIHLLLNFFAARKHKVVRLKGGDPFIFGRGGEELDYLEQRGVCVSVSAGITAAAGIAAELGMPLTKRGVAHSVQFVTGHAREGREVQLTNVDAHTTYVVYMGLSQLPSIAEQMMNGGLCASTPSVAVERGTTREQRIVTAPLSELWRETQRHAVRSPALVFVGDVVRLSKVWGVALVHGRLLEHVDVARLRALVDG